MDFFDLEWKEEFDFIFGMCMCGLVWVGEVLLDGFMVLKVW